MSYNQQRLTYIDICKSIGIILVVLGHTYFIPNKFVLAIYSFHMPFFFILSGIVFNSDKNIQLGFRKYFLKKVKQYLIPYFIFCGINLIIDILWKTIYTKQGVDGTFFLVRIKGIILCYSNVNNMPNCSPLWFLMCLFFASLLFWWIIKLDFKFSWIPIVICLIINYILLPFCVDYTSFPFKFPTFLVATFFMYIGYCFQKFFNSQISRKKVVTIISCLVFIGTICFIILINNQIGMNENRYDNYPVSLFTSVLISISLIIIIHNLNISNRFLTWLGKNTIYIVAFNYWCRDISTEIYYFIPIIKNYTLHWTISFLLTLIMCILTIYICLNVKKLYQKLFHLKFNTN